ncbi:MAG: hypothetical protein JOZ57_04115, partial [Abitibacteriaceae bacterium]|nr:hypothetical protein [Abditibacteriaceae bacterium]
MNLRKLREPLRPLKRATQHVTRMIVPPTERATNPFATHLPILIGIARLIPIRRVLELGSGQYSTLTFLDRTVFPNLEVLTSFEDDAVWMQKVATMTDDPRLTLNYSERPLSDVIADASILSSMEYDLVFVDNSMTSEKRAATISEVARRCKGKSQTTVLIHDYECLAYRHAAKSLRHRVTFTAYTPQTGVLWQQAN